VVTLGIVNTGIAYWLFYLLIDEAGAAVASVITYVMPVVALFLGVGLLGERLTAGAVAGLVLIASVPGWPPAGRSIQAQILRLTPMRQPPNEAPSAIPTGNEEITGFIERSFIRQTCG
jgi:EamA-like transporter family